ncbi:MFS transporter [Halococcus sp. IIIV-5B]|uniref:MFS transporter n=1 Tax=Halococcus sp. IIIV-5B TaxID=2321230 RepID=UPI000E751A6D|nr:MFS transporter [Halococcus sp. IIIV-5B]RJT07838.1 MFS transporter [Halococcus sp. IIIV-5B]
MNRSETSRDPDHDTGRSTRYVAGALIAGVFFGGIGGGVAFPTLPTLGGVLGIAPILVGLILSTNRIVRLVMNTPAGQILDRFGTRRPMLIGFFLQGCAPFGYVLGIHSDLVPVFDAGGVFLLSRAMWGFGSAFVFVGAFSTITRVTTTENRGKWVGYMRGGQSLGFPTGLIVGALIADTFGYTPAFLTAGGAGLFAFLVAFAVLPNIQPTTGSRSGLTDLPRMVRADIRIFTVGAVNFTVRFLFAGVLLSTVVLYAQQNSIEIAFLSGVGASGVVMALGVLCASLTTVIAGSISDRLSNRALLTLPALAVFGCGFALLALVPTLTSTLAGIALIGVGVGGSNPPLLAYLGDISPADDTGKLGGVYNVFGDLGSSVGPLVALPLAEVVGFTIEYLACVGFVVLAGVLVAATLFGENASVSTRALPNDD